MKVKELIEKLATIDGNADVVVYRENGEAQQFFGIDNVCLARGTPHRGEDRKPQFTFDVRGPVALAFLSVSPE